MLDRLQQLMAERAFVVLTGAGNHDVIELHGSLHRVLCLDCGKRSERDSIQQLMAA